MTESELSQRLIILETKIPYLADETEHLSEQIAALDTKVDQININLGILISQKNDAEKRLSRWKTLGLTVTSGLFLALVGWLAKIALIVQSSHSAVMN